MRHRASWIAVVVVLAALAGASVARAQPSADEILDKMIRTYAEAQDYVARARMSMTMKMGDHTEQASGTFTLIVKRPNRFIVEFESEDIGHQTIICTGRHLYTVDHGLKEWTRSAAPADLLGWEGGPEGGSDIEEFSLLGGRDVKAGIESASLERVSDFRGTPTYVLRVSLKDKRIYRLWVGTQDFLMHKVESTTTVPSPEDAPGEPGEETKPERAALRIGASPEAAKGGPDQAAEAPSDDEMHITFRYDEVKVNSGVSDKRFRFYPPPDYEWVTELSTDQGEEPARTRKGSPEPPEANLTGQTAPDFTLPDLQGDPVTLSQLRGKPVLLDFWASWCPACRQELPEVEAIAKEYADNGLQVIGISVDEKREDAQRAVTEDKLTFRVLWPGPKTEAISSAYQVTSIPRLLLIDAQGVIRADLTGYHEKAELTEALKKAGL